MGCYHPRRKIWIWLELKPQKVGVHHGTKPSREIEHSHCNANRHVQLPTDAPHRHPHVKGNRLETIAGGILHGATAWDRNPATKRSHVKWWVRASYIVLHVAGLSRPVWGPLGASMTTGVQYEWSILTMFCVQVSSFNPSPLQRYNGHFGPWARNIKPVQPWVFYNCSS